jgi:hypothetical protein
VSNNEGRGQDFKAEYTRRGRFLDHLALESAKSTLAKRGVDTLQHCREECAGSTTGIKNVDLIGGEPFRNAKVIA